MNLKFDKQTIMWIIVAVIAIALIAVYIRSRKNESVDGDKQVEQPAEQKGQESAEQPEAGQEEPKKESFTIVQNGINGLGTIGSITGDYIATTGTTWGDAEKALIKDGRIDYADGDSGKGIDFGAVGYVNEEISPLDQQMKNHNEVLKLANPNDRQYCTHEEHSQIANMVHGAGSNNVNLFKRGTTKSLNMKLDPLGTQMVIDEKYLPEKDRHGDMRIVKNVIAGKGYDINVERMGESIAGLSWSKINRERVIDRENGIVQGVGTAGTMDINVDNRLNGGINNVENDKIEEAQEMVDKEGFAAGKYGNVVKGNVLV